MAAFAAQLLDELMGRNRDANPNDKRRDIHWSDPEVCKYFICGICPHDLFTNTRSDLGACTKIHDESIKKEYQRSPRCEKMGYEEDLLKYLNTVIVEADKRIQRGQQRLLMAATEHTIPPTPEQAEIDCKIETIKDQISKLVEEAEALGNEGMVDAACEKTAQVDQLRAERIQLQETREKVGRPFEEVYKRRPMEVCDICGAMLFVDDAPQRLDDHIQGKQHMGYARIRAYITGYQKKKEDTTAKKSESENGGKDAVEDGNVDGLVVKDSNNVDSEAMNSATNSDRREENNEGKGDADRRRRDERSSERKRDDRAPRQDDHSKRRSRDRDSHRDRSRERHRSSDHSRRSDRSRSRSRRGSQHTSRSETSGRHHSRDRSRSRGRRDGSPGGRHGSRRSNHSRE